MDPMGAAGAAIPQQLQVPPIKEDDFIKKVMAQEPCDMKQNIQQATDKVVEMEDCFLCPSFCAMIPYEIRRCSNLTCIAFYCEDCIKKWLAQPITQGRCPHCRQVNQNAPYVPLSTFEKLSFNKSKLSGCGSKDCNKAQNPMTYEKFLNHLSKECLEVMIECPLGCLQKFKKKIATEHLKICPKATRECEACKSVFQNSQFKLHEDNCTLLLKKQISQLKLEFEEFKHQMLARDQASKINTQTLVNSLKSLQITKKIQLQDDGWSLMFIVKEGQQNTVYAGDYRKKQLLVISKLSTKPVAIDVQYSPNIGQLAMGESLLLVGCADGYLLVYSLKNVLAPALTYTFKLEKHILSMSKLNEQVFLVGQREGYLSVVDIVIKKTTTIQHQLNSVFDIACACKKGLLIVSANTGQIEEVSTHKPGTSINCIEYVRDSIVILGLWENNQLEVFNYSSDQVVQSISNPSANTYPLRIVRMNEDCFIIRDGKAISVIDINSSANNTLIQSIETNQNGFYVDSRDPNLIILHVGECQHEGKIYDKSPFKRNYLEFSMRVK